VGVSAPKPAFERKPGSSASSQLLQQRARLVVGSLVGVIGRAVAGGEAEGFLGMPPGGGLVAAGEGELGEFQVGIRALQRVAAALGDEQRLLGQPPGLLRRARGGAQPRQVNEDVGFVLSVVDAAAAFQRLVQVALGLVGLPATRCAAPSSQWARM